MSAGLDICRLKLARADEHLKALKADEAWFLDQHPYAIVGKFDASTSRYLFSVRLFEEPPPRLGLTIGDIVHNLSSALEHLAWELVLWNNKKPIDGRTGFPIFESKKLWHGDRGGAWMLEGVSAVHYELIDGMQPYHRGKKLARFHSLALLRRLWNIDKHRVLHTTTLNVRGVSGEEFEAVRDVAALGARELFFGRPFEDQTDIGWVEVEPSGPDPKVKMKRDLAMAVAFREPSSGDEVIGDRPVLETLQEVRNAARDIFAVFVLDF